LAATRPSRTRLLFVDDEAGIRQTMPPILEMHGFEVTIAGSVPEALTAMQSQEFDVLVADLNVGQPGDGFTIVSAMRRTQPQAVTLILTGYPAFDTALEAIRRQADAYVVKPAEIDNLLETIENLLNTHTPHQPIPAQRVPRLLSDHAEQAGHRWAKQIRSSALLRGANLNNGNLQDDARGYIRWLVTRLESNDSQVSKEEISAARKHGRERNRRGYSLPMVVHECHLLRRELLQMVEENLLAIEISYVVTDLAALNNLIDSMLTATVEGYLAAETKRSGYGL
jgi:ActR/RegA family two-component response regulator